MGSHAEFLILSLLLIFASSASKDKAGQSVCSPCHNSRQCGAKVCWKGHCGCKQMQARQGCFKERKGICARCRHDNECGSKKCVNHRCSYVNWQMKAGCFIQLGLKRRCAPRLRSSECASRKCRNFRCDCGRHRRWPFKPCCFRRLKPICA